MCPMYAYWCHDCEKEQEAFFRIADRQQFISCPDCEGMAEKLCVSNVVRDEPSWLKSSVDNLLPEGKDVKPIESRTELKKYLKENNIVQTG